MCRALGYGEAGSSVGQGVPLNGWNPVKVGIVAGEVETSALLHGCRVQGIARAQVVVPHCVVHDLKIGRRHVEQRKIRQRPQPGEMRGYLRVRLLDHRAFLAAQLIEGRASVAVANQGQQQAIGQLVKGQNQV